jgi:hypothetical protein
VLKIISEPDKKVCIMHGLPIHWIPLTLKIAELCYRTIRLWFLLLLHLSHIFIVILTSIIRRLPPLPFLPLTLGSTIIPYPIRVSKQRSRGPAGTWGFIKLLLQYTPHSSVSLGLGSLWAQNLGVKTCTPKVNTGRVLHAKQHQDHFVEMNFTQLLGW